MGKMITTEEAAACSGFFKAANPAVVQGAADSRSQIARSDVAHSRRLFNQTRIARPRADVEEVTARAESRESGQREC